MCKRLSRQNSTKKCVNVGKKTPNHQILVKSASRKALYHNKADFATKVRNQVKNVLMWTVTNNKALKLVFHVWGGTFDSNSLFKGGTFESKTCDCYIGLIRVLPPVKCDPFASFSPNSNHPVCQLINILALLPDILQARQPLKLKLSNPESVTVKQWLYLGARSYITQKVWGALFVYCKSKNIWFDCYNSYFLCIGFFHQ